MQMQHNMLGKDMIDLKSHEFSHQTVDDDNNDNNKTNIYTGYTLQQVKTAIINVCHVPYALMLLVYSEK